MAMRWRRCGWPLGEKLWRVAPRGGEISSVGRAGRHAPPSFGWAEGENHAVGFVSLARNIDDNECSGYSDRSRGRRLRIFAGLPLVMLRFGLEGGEWRRRRLKGGIWRRRPEQWAPRKEPQSGTAW